MTENIWNTIKNSLYALALFLQIDLDTAEVLSYLIALDMASGIAKAVIIQKIKFSFKKLYFGLITKFLIVLIPMTLALIALGIGYDFKWAVNAVLKLLIVSEGISIITNILSAKDGKAYQNKDYISRLLHLIRNWLNNKLEEIEEKFKK